MELRECPFCGGTSVTVEEGTTYRWAVATCADCGATASEVRAVPDVAKTQELALAEWNRRASPASAPANFKMVPVEPTMEMCEAGWNEYDLQEHFSVRFMYERMLAAAPTPPVYEDRKDAERYRWLRKEWFREDEENSWFMQSESSFLESPDEFDAAIDAAMEGK